MEQTNELARWSADLGVVLSLAQLAQFDFYLRELVAWNKKINLTAITQRQEIIAKHFIDSIACSKAVRPFTGQSSLLDIGSGAGFPGLPLKLAFPDLAVTLLEPNTKKTAFLRHIIGTLQLPDTYVIPKTLQQVTAGALSNRTYSHLITRALNISGIIHHCRGLLAPDGKLILCRSKPLGEFGNSSSFRIQQEFHYDLPCGYGKRALTILVAAS